MRISTKGVYAIEAMIDLGYYSKEHVESIKNIARRRDLSEKYLEQIVSKLKKANLIISTRGAGGGYRLAREAGEITVLQILSAVEGDLAPVECLTKQSVCGMDCDACATRTVWNGMWRRIIDVAANISLQQLIDEQENMMAQKEPEFYI